MIDTPGAIRQLTLKLAADNLPQAMRSTILAIEFDGQKAVWCPVEAFFGCGYQSHAYRTWYTEVTDDGRMSCFWVMPFEKTCRIELINLSGKPVEVVEGQAIVGPWQWDDRSMHFHAIVAATDQGAFVPRRDQRTGSRCVRCEFRRSPRTRRVCG